MHLGKVAWINEFSDPKRCFLTLRQTQFHLQHCMRETSDFWPWHWQGRISIPPANLTRLLTKWADILSWSLKSWACCSFLTQSALQCHIQRIYWPWPTHVWYSQLGGRQFWMTPTLSRVLLFVRDLVIWHQAARSIIQIRFNISLLMLYAQGESMLWRFYAK